MGNPEIGTNLSLREALRLAGKLGVEIIEDAGEYRIRWGGMRCVQKTQRKDVNRPFLKILRRASKKA